MGPPSSSSSSSPKYLAIHHFPTLSLNFPHFLSLFLFLSLLIASTSSTPTTIYDHLRLHGLPIGLLPKGITQYSHDPSTGHFQVFLEHPCNAKFENQVHYDFNVSGTLSFGRIGELSGVSAQELFLWFPVKGIRVDVPSSGLIYFDVGVVDKQFSLSLFESPPDCAAVDPSDPSTNVGDDPIDVSHFKSQFQDKSQKLRLKAGQRSELRAIS
ncbi:uncharacterized protein LOC107412521 isoform X1 [Ziziphus jujuba]|uniref:Uncharacterized protein LOC107412521 isoform X1 n=1 Tax=Ziziphus jujuba TaxID=326968 RepID=A0A6P3ZQB6_ZIZJJ|nr:uncharacterized protein LOC107412521 isoform X1 [Ziziphus jujuba]